jgi:hypothetical protein
MEPERDSPRPGVSQRHARASVRGSGLEHEATGQAVAYVGHDEHEGQYTLAVRTSDHVDEQWHTTDGLAMIRLARRLVDECFDELGLQATIYDQAVVHHETGLELFAETERFRSNRKLCFQRVSRVP